MKERRRNRWLALRRGLTIILSTLVLGGAAYGGHLWSGALVRSVYVYRTPLVTMSSAVETTRPLAMQVVLVVISGLRQDISERMPILQDLGTQGVRMVSEAEPPTYAQPTWTTLLTGAGPRDQRCRSARG